MSFLGIIGKVAGIAGAATGNPLLSAVGGVAGAVDANTAAKAAAATQMDFQQYNSDTAVQRRVKDLIAAGLNPMLAYSDVASTPGGSIYTPADTSMSAAKTVSSSASAKLADAQVDNTRTSSDLNRALQVKAAADADQSTAAAANIRLGSALASLNMTRAQNKAESDKTFWGTHVRPYLSDFFSAVNSGANSAGAVSKFLP